MKTQRMARLPTSMMPSTTVGDSLRREPAQERGNARAEYLLSALDPAGEGLRQGAFRVRFCRRLCPGGLAGLSRGRLGASRDRAGVAGAQSQDAQEPERSPGTEQTRAERA